MDIVRLMREGVIEKDFNSLKNVRGSAMSTNYYDDGSGFMRDGSSYSYIPEKLIALAYFNINYTDLIEYDVWAMSTIEILQYSK